MELKTVYQDAVKCRFVRGGEGTRIALLVVLLGVLVANSVAANDKQSLAEMAFLRGIALVACEDPHMEVISGIKLDSCLARAESVGPYCMRNISPLIADLELTSEGFNKSDNHDLWVAAMFALDRCIVAEVLVSDSRSDSTGNEEQQHDSAVVQNSVATTGSQSNKPARDGSWLQFVEGARKQYRENLKLIDVIIDELKSADYSIVRRESGNKVVALRSTTDGAYEVVTDISSFWLDWLLRTNVRVASARGGDVVLLSESTVTTSQNVLTLSYVSDLVQKLPSCTEDVRTVDCGSCEIDRSTGHRVVLSWFPPRLQDGQVAGTLDQLQGDLVSKKTELQQCWKEGMTQLGVDVASF